MKLLAELAASELIDADETEKDDILEISCEGFETETILKFANDKRRWRVDSEDLLEAVARVMSQAMTTRRDDD